MFFVNGTAFANWVARIPSVKERLDIDDQTLGLVLLAAAVGALLSFQAAGRIIARFGSDRMTLLSGVAFCALLPLPGAAPTVLWEAVALFAVGLANGMMDVAMNAQAIEVERRFGRPVLSAVHGVFSLGGLTGAGMGAMAAARDIDPGPHLGVVSAVLLIVILVVGRQLAHPTKEPPAPGAAKLTPAMLALGAVAFCSSVGEGAMADWAAVYLRASLHTGMGLAGLGYVTFSLAMIIGRFTGDRLTMRFGTERTVRVGGLTVAFGLGAALAVNTAWAMLIGYACVGAGLSVVVPIVFRAASHLPGTSPGSALATLAALSYGGLLAGPPCIGLISGMLTLRGGLGLVAVLALVLSFLAPAVRASPVPGR